MALVEINEMRRLENRKDKWYGFRTFVCPVAEVIQHVTSLRNQPFPEATPGICICNDTRTRYDADRTDGRAKIHAFYGPVDVGGGVRPRRKQWAELFTSPSGRSKKILIDENDNIVEGFDRSIPRGKNRWDPNFDNIIPDGIQHIRVRTAVEKPFSGGNSILDKGGKINREGGQWDWFGFGAETMYFLGMRSHTDFDDDSLVAIDYDFLYDREKWNENKKALASSLAYMVDVAIREDNGAPEGWAVTNIEGESRVWVPGIYVDQDLVVSQTKAEVDLTPFNVETFDFLQGMSWW